MTNADRSTSPSSSNAYGSAGRARAADAAKDDLASQGAAAFREAQASVEGAIADAGNYAGKKGREAIANVREVGDTLAVAIEKSIATRPYTTLALTLAAGFLVGATWRR